MRSPLVVCLTAGAALLAAAPAVAQPGLGAPHTTIGLAGSSPKVVATVGDVNGDGREDLFVQRETEDGGDCLSTAHIVLGAAAGAALNLDALGSRGITITGLPGCVPEWGVAALGDVNGDGRDDVGLADDGFTAQVRPTVIFGRAGGSTVSYAAPGTGGITFARSADATVLPTGIQAVGDVNGDGRADIGLTGGYGAPGAYRSVAGVLFGRPTGGVVDLATTTAAGLLIGDPSSQPSRSPSPVLAGVGDVNGDGKADVVTTVGGRHVIYGRSGPGFIDTRSAGVGASLGANDLYGVVNSVDTATLPDLNGDGARELSSQLLGSFAYPGGVSVVLSGRSAPHYGLAGSPPPLGLAASLGGTTGAVVVGERTRPNVLISAFYPIRPGAWVDSNETGAFIATYRVTDLRPRRVDLRTATTGVERFAVGEPAPQIETALRFRGTAAAQVVVPGEPGLTVRDVIERPDPPKDTTPPVITDFGFDRSSISSACADPCADRQTAALRFRVSEASYMELEIRRGTSVVSLTRGSVFGTSDVPYGGDPLVEWRFFAVDPGGFGAPLRRLPAGTYTAVLKATDVYGGNVGAVRTATIQVTG